MGKRILLATPRFAPEKPAFAPWGGNRYTQPEGGAFFREEAGKHLKTESPSPFSGHSKHRPKGLSPSGRARLVTGLAAEKGPFSSSDVLWGGDARPAPLLAEVAAPFPPLPSPWAFPRPGPRPPRPPGLPKPSPRDSQRLPTTQHPGRETGLSRRSCRSHHPVTGLRSVTTTAAALFLRLLGDPPTSLPTNEKRGRRETALRGPAEAFPRRKAKRLSETEWKWRGGVRSRRF